MVRHEERLRVSVARTPYQTVRFTRRVITETAVIEVAVRREVLDIERINLVAEATENAAADDEDDLDGGVGAGASGGGGPATPDFTIVLREEFPVVSVAMREAERIHVAVREVSGEAVVTDELRTEHVVVETAPPDRRR